MKRLIPALLAIAVGGCSLQPAGDAPAPASAPLETPREASAPPAPASPGEQEPAEALMFVVRSFNKAPVPAYASMAADAPVAFEAEHGESGDVLSSASFEKGGKQLTYWEVRCESGHGWIWDGHVDVLPRPKTRVAVASPPPRAPPTLVRTQPTMTIEVQPGGEEVAHAMRARGLGDHGGQQDGLAVQKRQSDEDVLTINTPGQAVNVANHLVRGQYTIIDVFSPKCGPCMRLGPQLEAFARAHPRVVLRKVDINRPGARGIDWGSPAALAFRVPSVPYLELYDGDGVLVASGDEVLPYLTKLGNS